MTIPGDIAAAGVFVLVTWALPAAFFVFVVYALVRYFTAPSRHSRAQIVPVDPVAILRERYARGEIDDDEYQRRLRILAEG